MRDRPLEANPTCVVCGQKTSHCFASATDPGVLKGPLKGRGRRGWELLVGWSAARATPAGRFRTTPRAWGDDEHAAEVMARRETWEGVRDDAEVLQSLMFVGTSAERLRFLG
jgi:hypothetical protein